MVYYVPEGSNEATVFGYRGNLDYSMVGIGPNVPQTSGDIEIASKLKINGVIYTVTSIGYGAFTGMVGGSDITSISIPSSVTGIGNQAFMCMNCYNLTQININKPSGSISGYLWGAMFATVNWSN